MKQSVTTAVIALAATTIAAAPAFAGSSNDVGLATPGILGLIALGVIGAIAAARWRK